jgi:hypothetical protein
MSLAEPEETTYLRAWEKVTDLRGRSYDRGTLEWEPGVVDGYEFDAHESLASVSVGEGSDGAADMVCAEAFGKLIRRLERDGAEVGPNQPIAEVSYRDPTLAEYETVWNERYDAERRIYELEHERPLRALSRAVRQAMKDRGW